MKKISISSILQIVKFYYFIENLKYFFSYTLMQHTKRFAAKLILVLLFSQTYLGISTLPLSGGGQVLGYVGTPADYYDALECVDAAQVFIDCGGWTLHRPTNYDYKGTVVVIDDGLSIDQWKKLESGYYGFSVDIVRYLTPEGNIPQGKPKDNIGDYGQDDLAGYTNDDLGYDYPGGIAQDHGVAVISALASIIPNVKIIFVNAMMQYNISGNLIYDIGFPINKHVSLWEWIRDNVENFDIDIVTASLNSGVANSIVPSRINQIYDKGVFMISSIGNSGIYEGNQFPQSHSKVYAIGSLDHENRGTNQDPDRYSKKGFYSGYAVESDLKSSFGSVYPNQADSLDFTMPGSGVPILSYNENRWVYGMGTSFSTPYFAAAVLIAIYAYNMGYYAKVGSYSDPTPSKLYSILKGVASEPRYDSRNGWGYVTLSAVYNQAYFEGYNSVSMCNPNYCFV